MENLQDLFIEQLKDMHNAEKQLTKALPKMAKAASSAQLREAFQNHLAETEGHIERLEQIFEELEEKPGRKKCAAMEGLIEEGKEMMEEDAVAEVLDAALIAAAQKVEHYEIASYGTLCTYAKLLGLNGPLKLLKQTLNEEERTDELLTSIATEVNQEALSPSGADEEEEAPVSRSKGGRGSSRDASARA